MVTSDLSAAVSLRMKTGHAASALKLMGLATGFLVYVSLFGSIRLWSVVVGFSIGWVFFWSANRLPWGGTVVVGSWTCLTAIYGLLAFYFILEDYRKYEITWMSSCGHAAIVLPLVFSARGLLARRNSLSANAAALWPPLPRSKVRPRFLNKWSIRGRLFVLLALVLLLLWFFSRTQEHPHSHSSMPGEELGEGIGSLVVALAIWAAATRVYRRGRRYAMLPGEGLQKTDGRRPVLYLRSFQDDEGLKVWARNTDGRILPERLIKISFEELVTDHLWLYGPVRTIGDPRKRKGPPSLGAARDFASDDNWHDTVDQLMRQSSMIVMLLGRTDSLLWEFDRVVGFGLTHKLILVFPPLPAAELSARWERIAERARGLGLTSEPKFVSTRGLVWAGANGHFLQARKHDDWTYETVLDAAAVSISGSPENRHRE
jgi:hypothetical protein